MQGTQISLGKGDLIIRIGWNWRSKSFGTELSADTVFGVWRTLSYSVSASVICALFFPFCWPAVLELDSPEPICCGLFPCALWLLPCCGICLSWQFSQWGVVGPAHLFKPTVSHKVQVARPPNDWLPGDRGGKQYKVWPCRLAPMLLMGGFFPYAGAWYAAGIWGQHCLWGYPISMIHVTETVLVLAIITVTKSSWLFIL